MDINTSSSHLRRRQAALAARSARPGVVATTPTDALSATDPLLAEALHLWIHSSEVAVPLAKRE